MKPDGAVHIRGDVVDAEFYDRDYSKHALGPSG